MILSHKYKFIFIKTAKTAGTSIEAPVDRALLKSFQLGYTVDRLDASGTLGLDDPRPELCPS